MNEATLSSNARVRYVTAITLDDKHLRTIKKILAQHLPQARVFAFGSRVSGKPRKYSDLDLAIEMPQPLDLRSLRKLKDALEDSDLPICVDIVDWNQASDDFRTAVAAQGISIVQPPAGCNLQEARLI